MDLNQQRNQLNQLYNMGALFDKHKIIHGLPLPGQSITYSNPTKFAFFTSVIDNEKLLTLGETYTVKKTELNSSSTYVWLEEFWDDSIDEYTQNQKFFSMHAFTWELPKLNLDELIGMDIRTVARLNQKYEYGIKFDKEVYYPGEPMLVLEYDKFDQVTKAFFE